MTKHDLTVAVVSFYMDNVAADVVAAQRAVLERFKPSAFGLQQIVTRSHGPAIDDFLVHSDGGLIVWVAKVKQRSGLKQTTAMLPPSVTIKRGRSS